MKKLLWLALWAVIGLLVMLLGSGAAAQSLPRGTKGGFVKTHDGVRIHYLEAGQGRESLLFIPGWTMPADIWDHQMEYFSKTHRVVAMDPRGQGKSDKPNEGYYPVVRARDVKEVVARRRLAPVVLVGWSMGVTELAAYVDQFGADGVSAIVLVDGIVGTDFGPELLPVFKLAASFQTDRVKAVDEFVRGMYRKPQSREYLERIKRAAMETPLDSSLALFLGAFTADYRLTLPKFTVPTLVLVAGDDKSNPWMKVYREVAEKIPGGKLEMMPGCGHAAFADCPDEFNNLVARFLDSRNAAAKK